MTDEQIIDLYWRRDEAAISQTAAKYGSYCYAIASSILSSAQDSEECVNDTYLRAWESMPPQRPGRLQMFLAKITRNLAFDRLRPKEPKSGAGERSMPCWMSLLAAYPPAAPRSSSCWAKSWKPL